MIKMLILDVDGTLTDGKIYIGENGEIMKAFCAHDAVGVRKLNQNGICPVIITGRESKITLNRAHEMDVNLVFQGVSNKILKLEELIEYYQLSFEELAYIGDDENDLDCMKKCGFCACPNDAIEIIKEQCNFISKYKAGEGAVREIIEHILKINV